MSCDARFKKRQPHLAIASMARSRSVATTSLDSGRQQHLCQRSDSRVENEVVVTGAAGDPIDLSRAQHAAKICVMRALALLQRSLGSLERVKPSRASPSSCSRLSTSLNRVRLLMARPNFYSKSLVLPGHTHAPRWAYFSCQERDC